MHDSDGEELRALRERAYGPGADIHDDPVALARLGELEGRMRDAATPPPEPRPADADPDPPADAGSADDSAESPRADSGSTAREQAHEATQDPALDAAGTASGPPPADEAVDAAPADPHRAGRSRRRAIFIAVAALAGAAIAGSLLTLAVTELRPGSVATLGADRADDAWPERFFGPRPPGGVAFHEFHGLRVVVSQQFIGSDPDTLCLAMVPSEARDSSIYSIACGTEEFPPVAALKVGASAPPELLERFPAGASLQFVLDGDRVIVYARTP